MTAALPHGKSLEEGVRYAQRLAREAFSQGRLLRAELDSLFGDSDFRESVLEPMLAKERQITALKARLNRGGATRGSDVLDLKTLLDRYQKEHHLLFCNCALNVLTEERRRAVDAYVESRRRQLYLGDADAVRRVLRNRADDQRLSA